MSGRGDLVWGGERAGGGGGRVVRKQENKTGSYVSIIGVNLPLLMNQFFIQTNCSLFTSVNRFLNRNPS